MSMRGLLRRMLFSLLLGMIATSPAWAQLPTSTLNGIVTDPQGAAVAGAKVTLTNKATGLTRDVSTGSEGQYVLANLLPGDYDIRIETQGFATREFKGVRLEVGRVTTLDVKLALGQLGQQVTVSEAVAQVDLTQSAVQGQITATTVENIPLNGRNFLELAFLLPGNRSATNFDPTKTNTLEVSSAGQFGRGGNLTVDGGDNNDEVVGGTLSNFPQDAVQEFQIATNRFTAEVGRSGSSIINIITKPGTNDWHGSGYAFVRNRKLQGLPATFDRTQCASGAECRPPFDRQHYGGSIGGPLQKDRIWWFFSGEDRHQNASVQTGFRDFNAVDPATGRKGVVRTSSAGAPLREALISTRADFKLDEKNTFAVRYSFNKSTEVANGSSQGVPLGSAANRQDSLNKFHSILSDLTSTISPTKVNSFVFHYDSFLNNIPAFSDNKAITVPNLGLTNELVFPTLQDGANFRIPQRTRLNRYQLRDTFSWTRGVHTFHFGGEWQNFGSDILFDLFGSSSIFLAEDFAGVGEDRNGDGVIDDRDIPISFVVRSTAPVRPPTAPDDRTNYVGFYGQDDWRVRSNLTFNLGLRWEYDTDIFGEGTLHQACPTPLTTQPTVPCVWLRGVLGLKRSRDPREVGPRFGFAWDPFKKGNTVVRGGYGMYYDRVVLEVKLLELLVDGRRLALAALNGSTCNGGGSCTGPGHTFDSGTPTLGTNPFSGAPSSIAIGLNVLANNIRHPRVQQFSLGVQQQLWRGWVVSADGIHNFGTGFLIGRALRNFKGTSPQVSCIGNNPCTVTDPLTGRSDTVTEISSLANTWYDGLLVSLQRRPTTFDLFGRKWGYNLNVNYTLSKSFNYANDDQIPFREFRQADVVMGGDNLRLEKGFAPTDERHRFVLYGVFQVPFGFSISPIWTYSSSVPIDAVVSGLAGGARLPILPRNALARDIQNGAQLNTAITFWNSLPVCPGSFPCRVGLPLSPVNPNLKFGDNFNSFDMRLAKTFAIGERHKFELMGEVFNLFNITNIRGFNRANYSGFSNDITSASFNRPLSTAGGFFGSGGPRAFQFAFKYSF